MRREPGDFQIRRSEVTHIDEVLHHASGFDRFAPTHRERQTETIRVNLAFHIGKRHSVVRRHDDQRVLQLAAGLQRRERFADERVGPLDLDSVVGEVPPHDGRIRQIGRHRHVGQFLSEAHPRVRLVATMRLVKAHPKTKRLSGLSLLQEGVEIFPVVVPVDPGSDRCIHLTVKARARGIAGALRLSLEIARSPALAREPDRVARPLQQIRIHLEALGEKSVVRDRLLQLPTVAPGENGRAAGAALGIRRKRILEQHALARHAIKVRRLHPRRTVGSGVLPTPVIENNEEDVRPRFGHCRRDRPPSRRKNKAQQPRQQAARHERSARVNHKDGGLKQNSRREPASDEAELRMRNTQNNGASKCEANV